MKGKDIDRITHKLGIPIYNKRKTPRHIPKEYILDLSVEEKEKIKPQFRKSEYISLRRKRTSV
jgi:hypothetical protein